MEPESHTDEISDIAEPPMGGWEPERLAELLIDAEQRLAEVPELKLRIADLEFELAEARRTPPPRAKRPSSSIRCSCTAGGCCASSGR